MAQLPFVKETPLAATPIHALRMQNWEQWIEGRPSALANLARAHDFHAQAGRILLCPATDGQIERVLFGLGESLSPMAFSALGAQLPSGDYKFAAIPRELSPTLAAVGWALGAYAFARYKPRARPPARLCAPEGADMAEASRLAAGAYLVRDLINTPAADMGPEALEAAARGVAAAHGAIFVTVAGEELAAHYPMIHAVGRAAKEPPRLLHLAWGRLDAPKVSLVGKGVTFDSGGLNIKPDAGMRLMKKDMGGAAHALGLAQIIMAADLPVRLNVFLPVAENAISADAFRPGDILQSRKGLTVEIDNTDAEGRLILGDALARASEDQPDLLIDFATLTGAARVALGPDIPPLFTEDDSLAAEFATASAETFDPIWRLPLWRAYDKELDSPIADMKNSAEGGMAGSIIAALFLRRFVGAGAWAHFDLYGWAPKAQPPGAQAQTLRACWRLLQARYGHAGASAAPGA